MTEAGGLSAAAKALVPKALVLAGMMNCGSQAPATVNLTFQQYPAQVTHDKSHAELGTFQTATQFSHSNDEVFLTGGITESNISTNFNFGFEILTMPVVKDTCLWVSEISITLSYAPVVHIASEYPQGSCRFNNTWTHELRHVNTDLLTLRENAPFIENATRSAAASLPVLGPFPAGQLAAKQEFLVQSVSQIVDLAFKQVDRQRLQRQQLIDTREEYMRMSKLCPNEPP